MLSYIGKEEQRPSNLTLSSSLVINIIYEDRSSTQLHMCGVFYFRMVKTQEATQARLQETDGR